MSRVDWRVGDEAMMANLRNGTVIPVRVSSISVDGQTVTVVDKVGRGWRVNVGFLSRRDEPEG